MNIFLVGTNAVIRFRLGAVTLLFRRLHTGGYEPWFICWVRQPHCI